MQRDIASLRPMPTTMKASAARTVLVPATAGSRAAKSAMFSVPVIMYSMPMPMT